MSGSSENDSSHQSGGESDREGSAASSHESELPDSRKRRRNIQIQGRAWVLHGNITTNLLHNDFMDGNADDDDAKVQNTKSQIEAALGTKFENLFQKMLPCVKYFVLFCNLVNVLHAVPAAAATQVKIQIQGFLQLGRNMKLTALNKLLKFPAFLSGQWARCENGLCGNEEYEACRAENSPWMPIQTTGEFGNSNKGRAANKSLQTAVISASDVLSFVFHLN